MLGVELPRAGRNRPMSDAVLRSRSGNDGRRAAAEGSLRPGRENRRVVAGGHAIVEAVAELRRQVVPEVVNEAVVNVEMVVMGSTLRSSWA